MNKAQLRAITIMELNVKAAACWDMAIAERKSADSIHTNARRLETLSAEIRSIAADLQGRNLKVGDSVVRRLVEPAALLSH